MQTKPKIDQKNEIENAWIETYTGEHVNVFRPDPDTINIQDIAHALAMCTRFNGHLNNYLSVAEHCYFVSKYVAPKYALQGLLHDAAEAYLSDVPRPIKAFLPQFKEIERGLLKVIFKKFGVSSMVMPEQILFIDREICFDEGRGGGMMIGTWAETDKAHVKLAHRIRWWNWREAEENYLKRFFYLHRREI